MNFLAHIFLSGEGDDLLKLGNFMGILCEENSI